MKKLFLTICLLLFVALQANAMTENDAKAFFNNYVTKANSYSNEISRMYAPNAVIIRQVIKPNGQLVNAYTNTATYLKQMKISEGVAKARNYKNRYTNEWCCRKRYDADSHARLYDGFISSSFDEY